MKLYTFNSRRVYVHLTHIRHNMVMINNKSAIILPKLHVIVINFMSELSAIKRCVIWFLIVSTIRWWEFLNGWNKLKKYFHLMKGWKNYQSHVFNETYSSFGFQIPKKYNIFILSLNALALKLALLFLIRNRYFLSRFTILFYKFVSNMQILRSVKVLFRLKFTWKQK